MNSEGLIRLSILALALLTMLAVAVHADEKKADCNKPFDVAKKNMEDIRKIYKYDQYNYIHYHDEEIERMKKRLPEDPALSIFMP